MRARTGVLLLLCGTLWTLALSTGLRAFHLGAAMLTGMAVIGLLSAFGCGTLLLVGHRRGLLAVCGGLAVGLSQAFRCSSSLKGSPCFA